MRRGTLLPDTAEVELGFLRPKDGTIQMHLRACRASAVCPECQTISSRVHSRYARELGDLYWEGIPVRIPCRLGSSSAAGRIVDGSPCSFRVLQTSVSGTTMRRGGSRM